MRETNWKVNCVSNGKTVHKRDILGQHRVKKGQIDSNHRLEVSAEFESYRRDIFARAASRILRSRSVRL
jgi:hypothetical protein